MDSLDTLLDRAASVAREVMLPQQDQVDRDAAWPENAIRALQAAGLGGLVVPRDAGGHGHGLEAVARLGEVLGRVCASTSMCFGMHVVGSAVIAAKATRAQREAYLEPIAAGRHFTTLALSEPGTGSHFYVPETRIEADPEGFRLTGTKSFVTNGGHSDSMVISGVVGGTATVPGEFSCLVVDAGTPGLSWGAPWNGWGMRGNSSRNATLEGVRVPRANLLGEPGDEIWYVFNVVAPYFLTAMSGTYLGVALAALDEARAHLEARVHSHTGMPLGANQVVQHRLGTLWGQVHRTRAFVLEAARLGDAGAPDALPALCSAKAEVAETAEQVASAVMTLLGGQGYREGGRIQRIYRDARAAHVMAPTTDMLRTWTGRALLGLPILGD